MLQTVGGCAPSSKAEGQGGSSGVMYGAGACSAVRCAELAWWRPLLSGCAGGTTTTLCSAAAVVRRFVPVLSTCTRGADRDVVLQHVQVACSKGHRGGCRMEGRGVSPGPEVDRLPVHVVRLGQGDPGEASVRQEVVAEDRLRAGVLHNNRGRMRVRGHCWRDLARAVVRCRGPGAFDDVVGAVDLLWLD